MKKGALASIADRCPPRSFQPPTGRYVCPKTNISASQGSSLLRVFQRDPYRLFGSPVPLQRFNTAPGVFRLTPIPTFQKKWFILSRALALFRDPIRCRPSSSFGEPNSNSGLLPRGSLPFSVPSLAVRLFARIQPSTIPLRPFSGP